jgi:transcriptional regulator with XRE-family HTH domain
VDTPGAPSGSDEAVGRTLAALRRSRKLSGAEVARRVGMSQPKISRLENGVGLPDPEDVGRIARELGAGDDEVRRLMDLAERSHNRMTDWRSELAAAVTRQRTAAHWESGAQTVRQFDLALVSGLLQTSGYARAVLSRFQELILLAVDSSNASVAEAVSARMRRQEVLADQAKTFHFILSESALSNRVCLPDEMPAQIRRLRQVARQDNVSLAIIPADVMWRVPPMHGFTLFDETSVAVDLFNTGLESHGKADARTYRQVFDWLAAQAEHDIDPILDRYLHLYVDLLRSPGHD